jgi:hypothetical protein
LALARLLFDRWCRPPLSFLEFTRVLASLGTHQLVPLAALYQDTGGFLREPP